MATQRKLNPRITPAERRFWCDVFLVSFGALRVKHNGKRMPAPGAAHIAEDDADTSLATYQRKFR